MNIASDYDLRSFSMSSVCSTFTAEHRQAMADSGTLANACWRAAASTGGCTKTLDRFDDYGKKRLAHSPRALC